MHFSPRFWPLDPAHILTRQMSVSLYSEQTTAMQQAVLRHEHHFRHSVVPSCGLMIANQRHGRLSVPFDSHKGLITGWPKADGVSLDRCRSSTSKAAQAALPSAMVPIFPESLGKVAQWMPAVAAIRNQLREPIRHLNVQTE